MPFKTLESECSHRDEIFVASLVKQARTAVPREGNGDVFVVTLICKDCGGKFRGEVRKV